MPSSIHEQFREHVRILMHKDGKPMPFEFVVLGVVGEWGELQDATLIEDRKKEAGDLAWYIQAAMLSLGCEQTLLWLEQMPEPLTIKGPRRHITALAEIAKKRAWHGKPADVPTVLGHLQALLRWLDTAAELEEALETNITKLKARYPQGFVEGGGVR